MLSVPDLADRNDPGVQRLAGGDNQPDPHLVKIRPEALAALLSNSFRAPDLSFAAPARRLLLQQFRLP